MHSKKSKMTLNKCYRKKLSIANALNKLCAKLDDRYLINYGGCCFVAYILFKCLEEDGLKPKLLIFDYSSFLDENDENYNFRNAHFHYGIKLANEIINGSDEYNEENYEEEDDPMDYVTIHNIKSCDIFKHYKDHSWNNTYDKRNNREVANIIKTQYFGITSNLRKRWAKSKSK